MTHLTAKNNEFINLEIDGYSKIVIDYYNIKNNIFSFIMLLMKNIKKLYLNIYNYYFIYKETNRIVDYFIIHMW